jgi:hypothetical protein
MHHKGNRPFAIKPNYLFRLNQSLIRINSRKGIKLAYKLGFNEVSE